MGASGCLMKVQSCMRDRGDEIRATHQISMKIVTQNENIQAELGRQGLLNLRAVNKTKR